jgi:hypothetical protein
MFQFLNCLKPRHTASKCDHKTKRKGKVEAFDSHTITSMPLNQSGSVDWCLKCLGKMAVRCAWCGKPIFIGDPITLYTPRGDFKVPEYAVAYKQDPLQLVGCLRWECADTRADRAGFWLPGNDGRGQVERVPTAYAAILGSGGNYAVIIGDAHDIAEAKSPTMAPLEEK